MKKVKWILKGTIAVALLAMATVILDGCKDDEPPALKLVSLTAGGIDLNAATSATGVPVGEPIIATFSTNVDEATLGAITLTRDYDETAFPATITADAKTVTINPDDNFSTGSLFILNFGAGLASGEGKVLSESIERNFTTEGTFAPAGVIAHYTFENSVADVVGNFDPANTGTDVTYVASRNTAAGKAASFNGTTTIIEVPNGDQLMANGDFAISFWVKADGSKNGHFVMGLAGWYGFQFEIDGAAWDNLTKAAKLATRYDISTTLAPTLTDAEDTWWNGQPNAFVGSLFAKDVSAAGGVGSFFKDVWAHVVCTYDQETHIGTMYVNGQKTRAWDFDLFPSDNAKKNGKGVKYAGNTTGGGNNFAIGFIQASGNRIISDGWADPTDPANNHFKGLLDDIRIYNTAFNETAILLMYNSEKP